MLEQQTQIPVQPVTITPDPNQTWTTESDTISDSTFAQAFADTVYQVMNAYSNASNISFTNPANPAVRTFMADIIGNTISLDYPNVASTDAVRLTQGNVALQQGEPNTDVQASERLLCRANRAITPCHS